MSSPRGYLLEIAGFQYAWCTETTGAASVRQWSQTLLPYIDRDNLPDSATISTEFETGKSDTGGFSIGLINGGDYITTLLQQHSGSPKSRLSTDHAAADTTIYVYDTTGFASSGYAWIGKEAIAYTGKTGTTLTGCTRASLGTTAAAYEANTQSGQRPLCYGYLPSWRGRKAYLWRYDPVIPATKWQIATGQIDDISFDGRTFSVVFLNPQIRLFDEPALALPYATGKVADFVDSLGKVTRGFPQWDIGLAVKLMDMDVPFPAPPTRQTMRHVQIGEGEDSEIISYAYRIWPTTVTTGPDVPTVQAAPAPDSKSFTVNSVLGIQEGDTIEVWSAGFAALVKTIQVVSITGSYVISHAGGWTATAGQVIKQLSRMILDAPGERGCHGTDQQVKDWPADTEVKEVRVLTGTDVGILLQLLTSTGAGTNGSWDVLPEGWGLGIPVAQIDTTAFQNLESMMRSGWRLYVHDGPVNVQEYVDRLAVATASAILWDRTGKLTARPIVERYPEDAASVSLGVSNIGRELPRWEMGGSRVRNQQIWTMDRHPGDQTSNPPRKRYTFEITDSVDLYGKSTLEPHDDQGMYASQSGESQMIISIDSRMVRMGWPHPSIHFPVFYETAIDLMPNDLVEVTIRNAPDMAAGRGISAGLWLVKTITPTDKSNYCSVDLLAFPSLGNTRLIAPAGRVESVSGTDVVLDAASTSHFSDDGTTEDIELFEVGDVVTFWDRSSFGGTPNTFQTTISSIDVGLRTARVAAVPGAWTLAAGDYMLLAPYDQWGASPNEASRKATYACMADETSTPPDLNGDDAHEWGG